MAHIFAHELGHIGRLKWIETHGREWWEYKQLMNSRAGKSLMRKLVMSWHGGRWNSDARREWERYTSDVEEFIAGLTGFYLEQSNIEIAKGLEPEEL